MDDTQTNKIANLQAQIYALQEQNNTLLIEKESLRKHCEKMWYEGTSLEQTVRLYRTEGFAHCVKLEKQNKKLTEQNVQVTEHNVRLANDNADLKNKMQLYDLQIKSRVRSGGKHKRPETKRTTDPY